MKQPIGFWLAALAVLIIGCALRIYRLDVRPMHGDEAVCAYKLGQLLEQNYYRYDPREFHGPALNYFTLVSAWLCGKQTYASVTETTLRIVPVFFGLLLVAMPLLLADGLGRPAAVIAAAMTAISPAFCFYSRYYIPEMLLVFFTFAMIVCGYRYARDKKLIWALLTGVFAGLSFAAKETSVIALGAVVVAWAAVVPIRQDRESFAGLVRRGHLFAGITGAVVVWGLFYSSFFTNPAGLLDSFRSFPVYFSRAVSNHIHPLYYYLKLLAFNKAETGPPWTEAAIIILSLFGLVFVVTRKGLNNPDYRLLDFLVVYTFIMLAVYSAIPYKTPWCMLSFYQGIILLAAVGVVAIMNMFGRMLARVVVAIFLITAATDLCLQSVLAGYSNVSNPYAYAQPTTDVLKIVRRVKQVSDVYPTGRAMPVWVVCPGGDYWPLPWYLRTFENVGWFNDVNEIQSAAPVVVASAEVEDRLIIKLYDLPPPGKKNLYVPLFDNYIELRPGVELRGYITKNLRDKWQSNYAIDANGK